MPHPFRSRRSPRPGASETITISGLAAGTQTLLVRAYDDAGNGSAVSRLVVMPEPTRGLSLAVALATLALLARRQRAPGRA